jgi:flagellar hook-basal body complex protein FliE
MNPVTSISFPTLPDLSASSTLTPRTQPRTISPAELESLRPDLASPAPAGSAATGSFENALSRLVQEVDARQTTANDAVRGLLAGDSVSLHQAMIASEEASISFQLMVEIRNKLLESYQEMMRMQI